MLAKKFFNSWKVFVNVPAVGSGYFFTASSGGKLNVYQMATDTTILTVRSTWSITTSDDTSQGNAAGNGEKAVVTRVGSGTPAKKTVKLTYASQAFAAGTDLTDITTVNSGWAHGNSTKALFKVGAGLTTVNAYTYATDTAATAASSQTTNTTNAAVTGNDTECYVVLTTGVTNMPVDRWTYSTETHIAGTSLAWGVGGGTTSRGNSVGNATAGLFVYPATTNNITKLYNYGAQTVATSTALTGISETNDGYGTSDGARGVMIQGNTTNKTILWTFAGSTFVNGGTLSNTQTTGAAGVSSGNPGVNI